MSNAVLSLPKDYWKTIPITKQDLEFINSYLFEHETPLTELELVPVWVNERIRLERMALLNQQKGEGKTYLPKENYKPGDRLVFPAFGWAKGKVASVRPGVNPEVGEFSVIDVDFEDGAKKMMAAGLVEHKLNQPVDISVDDPLLNADEVQSMYGEEILQKLSIALQGDQNLVRIAGRWFPRALLVDVNVGHLNLAEAVLDEAQGKPLPASALIAQVELSESVNSKLVEFSLNYALQEDGRFDEVGPSGEVLWCLRRLEPEDVQKVPLWLRYAPIEYDRNLLTDDMRAFELSVDDELSEIDTTPVDQNEVTISLTYPHWRAGTLPISARVRRLFPTAYESSRVRFTIVNGQTKDEIPAWVVREHRYVYGLSSFYQKQGLIPGSLITIRKTKEPGKVVVQAKTRRPTRDWVRTVLVGSDGGIVFAMLRQNITADYDERMVVYVTDVDAVDLVCEQLVKSRQTFEQAVIKSVTEMTKLNLQGHVHAQELYSALNITRRCPPGPMLWLLATSSHFKHVGDLYYRLATDDREQEEI